jgi:hypothetical protein
MEATCSSEMSVDSQGNTRCYIPEEEEEEEEEEWAQESPYEI